MTLSTKNITGRRNKVNELRKKHTRLFELEGTGDDAKYIPKMAYIPKPGADRIIAFFPSEIMGGVDVYTEFVSKSNEPEDPERRLWKWPFNAEYDTEYEKSDPHPGTGHIRYYIPVDELIDIAELHREVVQTTLQLIDPVVDTDAADDAPINQMTIRDKMAIDWKEPVSKKEWINTLIKEMKK